MITVKQHDTAWKIQDLLTVDDEPLDLNDKTIAFILRKKGETEAIRREATILTQTAATDPNVEWAPEVGDDFEAGEYLCEWEVTYGDGRLLTFPSDGYIELFIIRDLD